MRLAEIYKEKCDTPSDIYKLLPLLRHYSLSCKHITEMGVRTIVSTYALMHGLYSSVPKNGKLVSIDIAEPDEMGGNLSLAKEVAKEAGLDFRFVKGSSLELEIEHTDMLFIDTFHVYAQLRGELERHQSKVRKYIAMHDTSTFGARGEDPAQLGLWPAVEDFLREHPEWIVREKVDYCNGLTVLERKSGFAGPEVPDFKIPVFAVPVLNRGDVLERLIGSIDCPVETLCIINNGNDESVWKAIEKIRLGLNPLIENVYVYSECRNLGVAASWNKVMDLFPDKPYWFICAFDICFEKGSLKKMFRQVEAHHKTHVGIYGDGYACFCMTKFGWGKLDRFDENIYPAYMEDIDHHYRLRLSGLPAIGVPDFKFIHGDGINGSVTINSNERYKRANSLTHANNQAYYVKKWGGPAGHEKFTKPFNEDSLEFNFWVLDKEFRAEQERIWRETI